jgi:hypothetical protein
MGCESKQVYVVFCTDDGKELAAYSKHGTFDGELESTIALVAYEHGISEHKITVKEVLR